MRKISTLLTTVMLCLLLISGVSAQGGALSYGSNAIGSLSANAPLAFYTFNGAAGDLVTIDVIGISPGLDPAVSLNSPTQQQLANNDNSPSSAVPTDARISLSLPQAGVFTVLVSSVNGAAGDFLIRLNGQPAPETTSLTDAGADATVETGLHLVFSFAANPDGPTTLTVSTASPDFSFQAIVRDSSGQIIATLGGSSAAAASLNLPAGQQTYSVEVLGVSGSGQVNVSTSGGPAAAPPAEAPPTVSPPAETEEVGPAPVSGDCVVSSGQGTVNVRSGPGTNFSVAAQLQPGLFYPVVGIYTNWYRIEVDGIFGWVRNDVVGISGDCSNIPAVDANGNPATDGGQAPPPPQQTEEAAPQDGQVQQATPTYTPSYTPTTQQQQQQQATATYTPSYTPTSQPAQATATYTPSYTPTTPPAAQVAPEDARFNNPLNIPLDNTASVLDFVSYPGGDREDRVRWDISGMNQNSSISGGRARLVIAVSCFGQNTDQVQFFTGGQTYSCGQTIVDQEVTFNSKTGSVVITAVGGQGTYVQWVLTGTATRVN